MSYQTRAYDNEHGDPVVVLVATGTHDVSRLTQLLHRGNTEQLGVGDRVVRQIRRHSGGRAALRLLRDHGGPDFTETGDERAASEKRWNDAVDWLLNSRHCAEPGIQAPFWAHVDGAISLDDLQSESWVYGTDEDDAGSVVARSAR